MVQTLLCLVTIWDMRLAEITKSEQLYRQKFHIQTAKRNGKRKIRSVINDKQKNLSSEKITAPILLIY